MQEIDSQFFQKCTLQEKSFELSEIPDIDERLFQTLLSRLLYGLQCPKMSNLSHFDPSVLWVKDKDSIDLETLPKKYAWIRFAGKILNGGIYESEGGQYVSADREFSYSLEGERLVVKNLCDKQEFYLSPYKSDALNLRLRKKPGKELALVINLSDTMSDFLESFKELAALAGSCIFKDQDAYSKVALLSFSSRGVKDFGDFFEAKELDKNVKTLQKARSNSEIINFALILAMSHFSKDNGLKKEVYLITDSAINNPYNAEKMLKLTKNLNANLARDSENADNFVKIHSFSLKNRLSFLQELSSETGGNFYAPESVYEFKKMFLKLSNDGEDVWLSNELVPIKTQKLYDPDEGRPPQN